MSERPAPYDPTTTMSTEPTTATDQQHPAACSMHWPKSARPIPFIALPLMQRDIVLLLPVLRSPRQEPGEALPCLHLTIWKDGRLGFCNRLTTDVCYGCDRPLCFQHWAPDLHYVRTSPWIAPLCETCAQLPQEDMEAVRALRFQMNEK